MEEELRLGMGWNEGVEEVWVSDVVADEGEFERGVCEESEADTFG